MKVTVVLMKKTWIVFCSRQARWANDDFFIIHSGDRNKEFEGEPHLGQYRRDGGAIQPNTLSDTECLLIFYENVKQYFFERNRNSSIFWWTMFKNCPDSLVDSSKKLNYIVFGKIPFMFIVSYYQRTDNMALLYAKALFWRFQRPFGPCRFAIHGNLQEFPVRGETHCSGLILIKGENRLTVGK